MMRATTWVCPGSPPGLIHRSTPKAPQLDALQPVRGTRDLIGDDQRRYAHVAGTGRRIAGLYGFDEWSTPVFEDTRVFARTLGDTSDVVTKEMYTFADRGGDSVTLRAGGHRRDLPGAGEQRADPVAAAKGVLRRTDVPLRAAAEGALPAVPPDRRRADRALPSRLRMPKSSPWAGRSCRSSAWPPM